MAIDDIFQCTLKFSSGGQQILNILHYVQTVDDGSLTDQEQADDICELISDVVIADYLPKAGTAISWDGCECFILNKPTVAGQFNINSPGILIEDLAPLRVSAVAKKGTDVRGRNFRGRMYLPPCTEAQQSGGVLDATYITDMVLYLDNLKDVQNPPVNDFKMEVYSPTLSDPSMSVFITTRVKTFSINPNTGSQRGRQNVAAA